MALATGVTVVDLTKLLKNSAEAPARFMMAMADDSGEGMHYFMTPAELEKFCIAGIRMVCDGSA